MEFQHLLLKKEDGIEWITLNRPERLNALSRRMTSELIAALDDAEKDETVRVVIIKGAGRSFCAGADLKEYAIGGGQRDDLGYSGLWEKIEYLEKPVIAAVHGHVITGGFLLTYCCDIVLAAESAKFGDTHARLGLIPTGGESQRLPRRVGVLRAKELMFTSELIDARRAEQIGLVTKVVAEASLEAEAAEIARKIAANSARSVKYIKHLINRGTEVDFASGMRIEAAANKWGTINAEPDEDRDLRLARFRGG